MSAAAYGRLARIRASLSGGATLPLASGAPVHRAMIRRMLVAACLATCALNARADFTIERIEVRNAHVVAPQVLAAETLLREGTDVSEEDVRAGVRRLVRLYAFAVDYMLEPGSDAARRVVVINVRENHRLWFLVDARFAQLHVPIDALDYDFPDPTAGWKHAAAGVRWTFADGSAAHFGMTTLRNRRLLGTDYSAYEAGYTRRRILGTPFFATVIVRSPVDSLEEKTFTPEAIVGYPLTADQTLTLEYEDTSFRDDRFRFGSNDFRRLHFERSLSASWTHDTTDEPYTPMRGTFVKVEPFVWMVDHASFRQRPSGFEGSSQHLTAVGVDLAAERHWQRSEVSSFSAGIQAGWGTVRQRQTPGVPSEFRWRPSFEVIQGGYARRIGGSHVELEGRVMLRQTSGLEILTPGFTGTSYEASAAWARRFPLGTFRLGFTYTD
jgi:Omp85 superfamily domain